MKHRFASHRLTYPNALSDKVDVDYHQKLTVKFQIKNKQNDEVIRAQQAFLRFTNKKSNKEVIYLAEATSGANPQYKVDVVSPVKQRPEIEFFLFNERFSLLAGSDHQRQ